MEFNIESSKYPVVNVSWNDATKYCEWLSQKYNRTYVLPSLYDMYDVVSCFVPGVAFFRGFDKDFDFERLGGTMNEVSWNNSNSGYRIHPVGEKKPNQNHLYDMMGNCNQWCFEYVDKEGNIVKYKDVKKGEIYNHIGCGGSSFEEEAKNFHGTLKTWPEDCAGVNIGFRVKMMLSKGQSYK